MFHEIYLTTFISVLGSFITDNLFSRNAIENASLLHPLVLLVEVVVLVEVFVVDLALSGDEVPPLI